jgi:hypothetical protein
MASTRSSTTKQRPVAPEAPTETPKAALTALARRGAHIQIAASTAAAKTVADWAYAADRFAQTIGDELLRRVDGESDSPELVARLTAATSSHLRELAMLPRTASDHFDARLGHAPFEQRSSR